MIKENYDINFEYNQIKYYFSKFDLVIFMMGMNNKYIGR